jgi:hypothetical protein
LLLTTSRNELAASRPLTLVKTAEIAIAVPWVRVCGVQSLSDSCAVHRTGSW